MDSEVQITLSNRNVCCRLCLAPDNECVPIYTNSAADKEPLSSKILSCINIKVHEADRLSSRICHGCISYLNSWQSFKNRCLAAQKKQRTWLFLMSEKEKLQRQHAATQAAAAAAKRQLHQQIQKSMLSYNKENHHHQQQQQHQQKQQQNASVDRTVNSSSSDKNNEQGTTNNIAQGEDEENQNTFQKEPLDISCVKEEPRDGDDNDEIGSDDADNINCEIDPTQFLAANDDDEYPDDDDEPIPAPIMSMDEGPPILTSLGLTHINHVNSKIDQSNTSSDQDFDESANTSELYNALSGDSNKFGSPIPGNCSVCDMKFSNRANARRHERNIHGIKHQTPISFQIPPLLHMNSQLQNKLKPPLLLNPNMMVGGGGGGGGMSNNSSRKVIQVPEIFDYTTPSKYRQYLTENKIKFIRKNLFFLEQYQDMTCACCDKQYPTYKAFMSHMRKKFQFLPRNLCFKCLKQFETKGQFIAHLKKRNCLNLYRVYNTDDSITKPDLTEEEKARNKTKDILANKIYECKLCRQTFRLKMDFRAHVFDTHAEEQRHKDFPMTVCGFCNAQYPDPIAKKRHYTNLECIIGITCGTCNERYDSHPQYIEHVYATHLTSRPADVKIEYDETDSYDGEFDTTNLSQGSIFRSPQACPVCGKQYNNYYNVLRHMESKHPDQLPETYTCEHCQKGFPRQTELREHIRTYHRDAVFRAVPRPTYMCIECGTVIDTKEQWIDHMTQFHAKFFCPQCVFKTRDKTEYDAHLATHLKFKLYSCTICKHSFNNERGLETHMHAIHNIPPPERSGDGGEEAENDDDESIGGGVTVKQELDDDSKMDTDDIDDQDDGEGSTAAGSLLRRSADDDENVDAAVIQQHRECPICKAIFNVGVAFSNHMRTHIDANGAISAGGHNPLMPMKKLRCRICHKRINTKLGMKRHLLISHQVRDYPCVKCYMCPAEFSNHKGLRVHLLRSHQITKDEDDQNQQEMGLLRPQQQQQPSQLQQQLQSKMEQFECEICFIVYRNADDLKTHRKSVHNIDKPLDVTPTDLSTRHNLPTDEVDLIPISSSNQQAGTSPAMDIWFQCRYCNETFNSSKKLTIHMNTHDEHDQTDYSCKDCGNVYISRKSLWVHRYKKHPRPPNPIVCEICKKTFFDKTELYYHLKTHSHQGMLYIQKQNLHPPVHKYQQQQEMLARQQQQQGGSGASVSDSSLLVQPTPYPCHVCGQKFNDKINLSKHMRLHEMENMLKIPQPNFDDSTAGGSNASGGGDDYKFPFQENIQMVNGEYACDLCPKTFPILNALHVHRGWHFRSPSGRQVTDPSQTWQPDAIPPSKLRRMKNPYGSPPVCPFCNSTFASTNNLRRHIVEVHKRNEAKQQRENETGNSGVFIEKVKECQSCNMTFKTVTEWVDHKIIHARNQKPSTTFEWNCEICGKMFTRKERLLQHMITHLNSHEFDDEGNFLRQINQTMNTSNENSMSQTNDDSELNYDGNSQDGSSQSSLTSNSNDPMNNDENGGGSDGGNNFHKHYNFGQFNNQLGGRAAGNNGEDAEKFHRNSSENNFSGANFSNFNNETNFENEQDDDAMSESSNTPMETLACELCQKTFTSREELRVHVSNHILNGGNGVGGNETSDNSTSMLAQQLSQPLQPLMIQAMQQQQQAAASISSTPQHLDQVAAASHNFHEIANIF